MVATLCPNQFKHIAQLAKERWGLDLPEKKAALVQNRMAKFVVRSHYDSIEAYIKHLRGNPTEQELLQFFDLLSTNTTSFFRESRHFDFLASNVYPGLVAGGARKLRIWSAACSNGSEPYTIAMHAEQQIKDLEKWDFKILATDLSESVLAHAKRGAYPAATVTEEVPQDLRKKCFTSEGDSMRIVDRLRKRIAFHQLNLMDSWPMSGPFDVIFLRNVMIYFDTPTRDRLVQRMRSLLTPRGYLIVGSAETLSKGTPGFRTAIPSVYEKCEAS